MFLGLQEFFGYMEVIVFSYSVNQPGFNGMSQGFCFTLPYFQLQDLLLVQNSGEKTTWDVSEKTPA